MERLTVLYDASCPFCVRCAEFLVEERSFVAIEPLAAGSDEARRRYGSLPWSGAELVVVADDGRAWVGAPAFLVCLWALERFRGIAEWLSEPLLLPLAVRFFAFVSARRRTLATLVRARPCDDGCRLPAHAHATGPYR